MKNILVLRASCLGFKITIFSFLMKIINSCWILKYLSIFAAAKFKNVNRQPESGY